ncbi:3-deoxy-7-phosphoheptulonate synthase [Streptomyces sp. NPDC001657]|uniref:3-deoxy-7-phosphoheptulonate synthase n=1 Tax=Streptomyces sp. NPDC001657 TaxID=3154522 RepID=UPI00331EDD8F
MRSLERLHSLPAEQQPDWPDTGALEAVREELARAEPLVRAADVRELRGLLARAAAGELQVIQTGDCAEDPAESTPGDVARKTALLDMLAGTMKLNTDKPVIRVGRIAGQYGKPRSRPTEVVGGVELPVYRGHMVNRPEPDPELRRPDPGRMLLGLSAARQVTEQLGWTGAARRRGVEAPVWTSHEALLLDYELAMVRAQDDGGLLLTSTHWPWIGERTRQVDGAHVALLAAVGNPVACKVGPSMAPDVIRRLCERLDPHREPGRLTLIARMGADAVRAQLPALVRAVREAGHPVIWLTDPMHGNTVTGPVGLKTRCVETVIREVTEFQSAVSEAGGVDGGLHLETTPDQVTECGVGADGFPGIGEKYTTLCDPRLNPSQAVAVAAAWRG